MSEKLYRIVPYDYDPSDESVSVGRREMLVEVEPDYEALALVLDDIFHGNKQRHSATDVMNAALEGTDDECKCSADILEQLGHLDACPLSTYKPQGDNDG